MTWNGNRMDIANSTAQTAAPVRPADLFLETIFRLDAEGDVAGFNRLVESGRYGAEHLLLALRSLLVDWRRQPGLLAARRLRSTYILALILDKAGLRDILISLALSAGGLALDRSADEARGLALLRAQADAQSPEQQFVTQQMINPVMAALLNIALSSSSQDKLLRAIEILQAAVVPYRTLLDWHAPVPLLSLAEMRQRGQERARTALAIPPLPPAGVPRRRRRVLMACGEQQHRGIPLRMANSMNSYGWQAALLPGVLRPESVQDDCRSIADICRRDQIELLVFDASHVIKFGDAVAVVRETIARLRQDDPDLRVLGLMIDSDNEMELAALQLEFFDGIVSYFTPSRNILENRHYARRMLYAPVHSCGWQTHMPDRPLLPRMLFDATINTRNWMRMIWITAIEQAGLPIDKILNMFSYDHPLFKHSPTDYYAAYRQRIAEATCGLSLSSNGVVHAQWGDDRRFNGRSLEVLLSGALLVQEVCPNLDCYLIAGEHYLEFSTVAELAAVMRWIADHREEAEEVRQRGCAFAREHWRDERTIGYIDRFLYFSDR
ncbi:MAG: glycosyltransferase [Magnetococcus sp. DMHC-8]